MNEFLLDVNVLMALAWPTHVHHQAAHAWFEENQKAGWATCPLTQIAFVRLSLQPAVVKTPMHIGDVLEALTQITTHSTHRFWRQESGFAELREEVHARVVGHQQVSDAVLLDLALRNRGRLATFDRKILGLLPSDSNLREAVTCIPG